MQAFPSTVRHEAAEAVVVLVVEVVEVDDVVVVLSFVVAVDGPAVKEDKMGSLW